MVLWHLTTRADWDAAVQVGEYRAPSLAEVGFIHLSTEAQWLRTANRFYRGTRLVRLAVDDAALAPEALRYEPADGELFPHLYGPLPLAAVSSVVDLDPASDGSFEA